MKKFILCTIFITVIFSTVSCKHLVSNNSFEQDSSSLLEDDSPPLEDDSPPLEDNSLPLEDNSSKDDQTNLYLDALSDTEIKNIEEVIYEFYNVKTIWKAVSICVTDDKNPMYQNEGIESEYQIGNIIIYDVVAKKGDEVGKRTISVVRKEDRAWEVINEGF